MTHEQSGHHVDRDGSYAWDQHLFTKADLVTAAAECQCWTPDKEPFPRWGTSLVAGRLITLEHLLHGRTTLCPYWSRYLMLVMDLPFLYVILLPKLPYTDLQNAFSTSRGIPYIIASDKGSHFRSVAVSPWSWNPLLLPSSLLPWNSWPGNKMKWPFEDIVTVPIGGSSLKDWGRALQKAVYALTQCPIYDMFFPHSQNLHVQESKLEKGIVPFTITTSDPLENFCFLFLWP